MSDNYGSENRFGKITIYVEDYDDIKQLETARKRLLRFLKLNKLLRFSQLIKDDTILQIYLNSLSNENFSELIKILVD
jgi:hypothetical protein